MHREDGSVKSLVMANLAHPALPLGGDAKKLPLHITIVPPFWHDRIATGRIAHAIGEKLADIDPFTIVAHEEVMLGVNEQDGVLARKVGAQTLYTVHDLLMPVLLDELPNEKDIDIAINTKYANQRYTPHATHTETQRLNKGEMRYIDALYLFQKTKLSQSRKDKTSPNHPVWYVAAKYPLGKGHETAS